MRSELKDIIPRDYYESVGRFKEMRWPACRIRLTNYNALKDEIRQLKETIQLLRLKIETWHENLAIYSNEYACAIKNLLDDSSDDTIYPAYVAKECAAILSKIDMLQHHIKDCQKQINLNDKTRIGIRNNIVCGNLKLVLSRIKYFRGRSVPVPVLISVGNVALIDSIDKYDFSRNAKFSTFAVIIIDTYIRRELSNQHQLLKQSIYDKIIIFERGCKALRDKDIRHPTDEEICDYLNKYGPNKGNWTTAIIARIRRYSFIRGMNKLQDISATYVEERADTTLLSQMLNAVDCLDERSREIIISRWGLHGRDNETLKTIGTRLKLNRERIRQIESAAFEFLRNKIAASHNGKNGTNILYGPNFCRQVQTCPKY